MTGVRDIPVDLLQVDEVNPRGDAGDVDDLAASIADQGVLQPLIVRPLEGRMFGVVAGRRRWAAAVQAGFDTVPCDVRQLDTVAAAVVSATENLARRDLDPITEAETFARLVEQTGLSKRQLAGRLGVAESTMVKRLKLLDLPQELRELVRDGEMSVGAAYRMVKKSQQARSRPRRRLHAVTDDDTDFLDVVAVADDLVRQVKEHLDEHVDGESVTDFVARAVRRELARPSCQEDGCWGDAVGGGRWCSCFFQKQASPPPRRNGAGRTRATRDTGVAESRRASRVGRRMPPRNGTGA